MRVAAMIPERMRLPRSPALLLSCLLALGAAPLLAVAQDDDADGVDNRSLSLFEQVESTNNANTNNSNRPVREARATTSEPEFTLVGTSRIGDKYSAMIRHKDGEVLLVKAKPNENTSIQDHAGYSIVDIAAGSVSVRYPGNIPCVDFNDRGVRCSDASNIAQLVLANGEPLASTNPAAQGQGEDAAVAEGIIIEGNSIPANPFEALRNAQNARANGGQDGAPGGRRFTPRRIDPSEVPEGMRIISTPFGDRLVEQ